MSQVRSGHRRRSGSARWKGHEPRQGGGGAAERQERRLAQRQTEEEDTCQAVLSNRQTGRPAVKVRIHCCPKTPMPSAIRSVTTIGGRSLVPSGRERVDNVNDAPKCGCLCTNAGGRRRTCHFLQQPYHVVGTTAVEQQRVVDTGNVPCSSVCSATITQVPVWLGTRPVGYPHRESRAPDGLPAQWRGICARSRLIP